MLARAPIRLFSLPVTVKDAKALLVTLTNPSLCAYPNNNSHIRLLHDEGATREAILNSLNWLKERADFDSNSTIIIYYSGHGWLNPSSGNYYLIPHEAAPQNITKSALSAEDFTDAIRRIECQRLLVIIDSCHAEGMATAKNHMNSDFIETAPNQKFISELKQGRGRAVFTSSSGAQKSWICPDNQMSIYTYHLIEALKGSSKQTDDSVVRLSNLMNHISRAVPTSANIFYDAKQIPFFDMATEDFAVAMLRGGKGTRFNSLISQDESMADKIILTNTLEMARQSLKILEEQAAGFGILHMPPHLRIELEAKRHEVSELEKRLND